MLTFDTNFPNGKFGNLCKFYLPSAHADLIASPTKKAAILEEVYIGFYRA